MKALLFIIALLSCQIGYGQMAKTIYKTFPQLDSVDMVDLQFNYPTKIEEWTERRMLVETTVRMTNANRPILTFLIEQGRYDLKSKMEGGAIALSYDEIDDLIVIKGYEIYEDLSITVFVPKGKTVVLNGETVDLSVAKKN